VRALRSLYVAAIREFVRDPTAVFWNTAFPILFMLVAGIAFSGGDSITLHIGVVNQDGDASMPLVDGLRQIEAFKVTEGDLDGELEALESGDRDAVLMIPAGTGTALETYLAELRQTGGASQPSLARLPVYYDPADQNTSQLVLGMVDRVITAMSEGVTGIPPALTVEPRSVSSHDLRYLDYLLPGVLAMSLMQLGLYGTAEPLVSLRERQVLRRLGATPLAKTTLLASQIAFRLTVAVATAALILAVGMLVFGIHVELSNILSITAIVILGAVTFITLGYFLSGLARTEQAVQGILGLPYFVFMFLSGIFFPLDQMPGWIRPLIDAIPLTYLGDALRKTMLEAGSYFSMARNVVTLGVWLAVCALLAVRFFRWEAEM
jgi:ABC-2 type transport system permease protein